MRRFSLVFICSGFSLFAFGQRVAEVPHVVSQTLLHKYPQAKLVSWEMEKGNYEANWGGKSKEDSSVLISPEGKFLKFVRAVPISDLPVSILAFVRAQYNGADIREAGRVTDAKNKQSYQVEIPGKNLLFTTDGKFIAEEQD